MYNQNFLYKKDVKWEGIIFLFSWFVLILLLFIKNIDLTSVLLVSVALITFGPIFIFVISDTLIYKIEVSLSSITIWKKFTSPLKIKSSKIRKIVLDEHNSIMSLYCKDKTYKIDTSKLENKTLFIDAVKINANKNNFNITYLGYSGEVTQNLKKDNSYRASIIKNKFQTKNKLQRIILSTLEPQLEKKAHKEEPPSEIMLLLKNKDLIGNSLFILNKDMTKAFLFSFSDDFLNEYSPKIEKEIYFFPKLQAIIEIDSWVSAQITYLEKELIAPFILKAKKLDLQITKK